VRDEEGQLHFSGGIGQVEHRDGLGARRYRVESHVLPGLAAVPGKVYRILGRGDQNLRICRMHLEVLQFLHLAHEALFAAFGHLDDLNRKARVRFPENGKVFARHNSRSGKELPAVCGADYFPDVALVPQESGFCIVDTVEPAARSREKTVLCEEKAGEGHAQHDEPGC